MKNLELYEYCELPVDIRNSVYQNNQKHILEKCYKLMRDYNLTLSKIVNGCGLPWCVYSSWQGSIVFDRNINVENVPDSNLKEIYLKRISDYKEMFKIKSSEFINENKGDDVDGRLFSIDLLLLEKVIENLREMPEDISILDISQIFVDVYNSEFDSWIYSIKTFEGADEYLCDYDNQKMLPLKMDGWFTEKGELVRLIKLN